MPTYIYGFLAGYSPILLHPIPQGQLLSFLGVIFVSTAVVPAVSTLLMVGLKVVKSLELSDPRDRIFPMFFTGFFYLALAWMLHEKLNMEGIAVWILIGMASAIFASVIITFFTKISAHAVGAAGTWSIFLLMAMLHHDSAMMAPLIVCSIMAGAVLSARLYLGAHNLMQIVAGVLLGICVSLLLLFV